MSIITGLTSNTKKNLQLDAGALFKNYNPASDTPATATAKLLGATVGGATLALTPEIRQIEVDGAKGPTKGLETIDSWTCTLTANLKEVTVDSIKTALGSATSSTPTSPASYTKIVLNEEIVDGDYLSNVTWIGKMSGSNNPIMIVLKNALCLNGFQFTVSDKSEGNVPIVLTAHYDVADLETVPVEIYVPNISA